MRCFEACSAFTRVTVYALAEPPKSTFSTEALRSMSVPSRTAPIAAGWNEQVAGQVYPRWDAVPWDSAQDHRH